MTADITSAYLVTNYSAFWKEARRGALGVTQVIRNVGDATIQGGEI